MAFFKEEHEDSQTDKKEDSGATDNHARYRKVRPLMKSLFRRLPQLSDFRTEQLYFHNSFNQLGIALILLSAVPPCTSRMSRICESFSAGAGEGELHVAADRIFVTVI